MQTTFLTLTELNTLFLLSLSSFIGSLLTWIQQSETNGEMRASAAFDPSDRWAALSFHLKLGKRERAHEKGNGVGAYAPRLLSAWIHSRPLSGDFPSLETGLSQWVLILLRSLGIRPLPDPPSHYKITASATFLPF